MTEQADHGPLISLAEAAKTLPQANGKNFSTNTVWRWARKGVKSRAGDTIRLQHVRLGGKIYTTRQWVDEFGARLAQADAQYFEEAAQPHIRPQCLPPKRSHTGYSKERLAQIERAEQELRDMGV